MGSKETWLERNTQFYRREPFARSYKFGWIKAEILDRASNNKTIYEKKRVAPMDHPSTHLRWCALQGTKENQSNTKKSTNHRDIG